MDIENFRIKLEFNVEEMNLIFKFLESIPYGQVAGLYENIRSQIDPQLVALPEKEGSTINTDYPV
jgi:hypothetical protein